MNLGDKIRELREGFGLTQGHLAGCSSVSQGYLSQLENGEVKNPSAAVLLRVAQAMHVDPDELFEAAGYPTVRTLRQVYEGYQSTIEPDLLRYLSRFPRERQRRLLLLLEGMENLLGHREGNGGGQRFQWGDEEEKTGPGQEEHAPDARLSRLQG
ncbi:MAG: helix-turn-helix transcriptional regulator [Chloroflexi bacterium]|nr:helix-turn-helix transcriptional regulator [Chloroflexota bacterium]